jgi:hypothetical protein
VIYTTFQTTAPSLLSYKTDSVLKDKNYISLKDPIEQVSEYCFIGLLKHIHTPKRSVCQLYLLSIEL